MKFEHSQEPSHGEDDETIWLLSYADLMTLLFTFFVMLYSSVMMDEGSTLRKTLAAYLQGDGGGYALSDGTGGKGGGGSGNGVGSGSENEGSSQARAVAAADFKGSSGPGNGPGKSGGLGGAGFATLQRSLNERIEQEQVLKDVSVQINKQGLDITFSSNLLFELGKAELRPEVQASLQKIIQTMVEQGRDYKIRVEGHTDDNPIVKGSHKSNWELSGARAAHIVTLFEKGGFPAENMVALGYGSSRPVRPNRMPSGEKDLQAQKMNRRVILMIYSVPE